MSRGDKWVPLDKYLSQEFKHINRPFSRIEAMFSYTLDIDNDCEGTINGYSKLWQWSRDRVRKFINGIRQESGHESVTRSAIIRHPIHFIDKGLWDESDTNPTRIRHESDTNQDTTTNPNPNPNPNPKKTKHKYGEFKNVLLTDDELKKLEEKFNSHTQEKIEALSLGIESKGYKYKSHYATILSWARKEEKENDGSSGEIPPRPKTLKDLGLENA